MPPDFAEMNQSDLRAYTIAHPNDQVAFHAFGDRFTADAPSETFDIPQVERHSELLPISQQVY
ncbi:MAG: hypothetical protein AAF609_06165 [Cyanobacteria bacterium P01_C01_bin.120]